jgi:hypothetical protein
MGLENKWVMWNLTMGWNKSSKAYAIDHYLIYPEATTIECLVEINSVEQLALILERLIINKKQNYFFEIQSEVYSELEKYQRFSLYLKEGCNGK